MKSVCVTKAKAYYIIADGYTECYTFNSREEAESFIELFKPFYKNKTVMIQEANVFTSYIMNDYIIKEGNDKIFSDLDGGKAVRGFFSTRFTYPVCDLFNP